MPEAKVEKYKITKEMMEFSKNFKKISEISKILQQGLQVQLGDADQTRKMLHQAEGLKEQMLNVAPQPTHEIEGQEGDIKDLYINY